MKKFIYSPMGKYFNVDHIVTFYDVDYENSFCIYIDAVNGEDYIFDEFATASQRNEVFYNLMKNLNAVENSHEN